ncbi:vitamin-D-receptor interacting mediator subunit 4-domain-containing protein [Tricharina praecox]|uniref:vitamin-D-receptor interacting mediator subunit 4-domain-containing protein n=1 Tax=Tricharina praecox TaxID=43433 RepID=UPI002220F4D6|nr:vitamin-D-receptor interacting mediator subunit 4-domain-containing protein [Tricharina praecox]KAI5848906.1 vitamin-D-receptor interacting mediator subunit 4-domain-containing protein [Tricharina praecox]
MDASVYNALDNLERNIQQLLESVASYNPSPAGAVALVQSDDELTLTLKKLEEHQQATQRILTLSATSALLDSQLTSLLSTLSAARQQLLATPSTRFTVPPREVAYNDLLAYAAKISKYSRPSNPAAFRKHASAGGGKVKVEEEEQEQQEQQEPPPLGMSEEEFTSLDPSGNLQFTPWPNEILMRQGALQAVGPDGVPEDMVPEAERRKIEEEGEKVRREMERVVNGGPSDADEKARRNSGYAHPAPQRDRPPAPLPPPPPPPQGSLTFDLWQDEGDDD